METVYIVDDDGSVRDALSLLLSLNGYTTATFASGEDFLAACTPEWRGCAVLDLQLPGLDGLALQRRMHERGIRLPIVILTAHGDIASMREAFLGEAIDFLPKPFDSQQLLEAVARALSRGRAALPLEERTHSSSSNTDEPAAGAELQPPSVGRAQALTAREREVMDLLLEGRSNREIASLLGISHRTVEVHKGRVLEKHAVRSVIELAKRRDSGSSC